jgi:DNA primase
MQNIKLRRSGRTFSGLCPFHNERHPSLHIYPHNNSFYCYGCNKGGNVINFVRELQGLSFREAVEYLTG